MSGVSVTNVPRPASPLAGPPDRYDAIGIESAIRRAASRVILELKAVEHLTHLHNAQLSTYSRLNSCRIGLPINFNTMSPTDGIRRRVP